MTGLHRIDLLDAGITPEHGQERPGKLDPHQPLDAGNLAVCCRKCNGERRDLTVADFCAAKGYEYSAVMARVNEETDNE